MAANYRIWVDMSEYHTVKVVNFTEQQKSWHFHEDVLFFGGEYEAM